MVNWKKKGRVNSHTDELENIVSVKRYRISSIEPNLLSDEIIKFVSQSKKFLPFSYPIAKWEWWNLKIWKDVITQLLFVLFPK